MQIKLMTNQDRTGISMLMSIVAMICFSEMFFGIILLFKGLEYVLSMKFITLSAVFMGIVMGHFIAGVSRVTKNHPFNDKSFLEWLIHTPWRPSNKLLWRSFRPNLWAIVSQLVIMVYFGYHVMKYGDIKFIPIIFLIPPLIYYLGYMLGALSIAVVLLPYHALLLVFIIQLVFLCPYFLFPYSTIIPILLSLLVVTKILKDSMALYPWDDQTSLIEKYRKFQLKYVNARDIKKVVEIETGKTELYPFTHMTKCPVNKKIPFKLVLISSFVLLYFPSIIAGIIMEYDRLRISHREEKQFVVITIVIMIGAAASLSRLWIYSRHVRSPTGFLARFFSGRFIVFSFDYLKLAHLAYACLYLFFSGVFSIFCTAVAMPFWIFYPLSITYLLLILALNYWLPPSLIHWKATGRHGFKGELKFTKDAI